MSLITLYVSGEYSQIIAFYAELNAFCAGISIAYTVLDPTICTYDLATQEKSDAFYTELASLLGTYTTLNFSIV